MRPSSLLPVFLLTASAAASKSFPHHAAQAPLDLDLPYANAIKALDTNPEPSHLNSVHHSSSSALPGSSTPTTSIPQHRRPMVRRKIAPADQQAQNGAAKARKIVGATALGILIFVVF